MNATLTFDLSDPDGQREHMRCCKALDMALVLWEIQHRLRDNIDHHLTTNQEHDGAEAVLNEITIIMQQHNINLDELII